MIYPFFETDKEKALEHTTKLKYKCEHCGDEGIIEYTDGINADDTEKLEDIKTIECPKCDKELGTSTEVNNVTLVE